MKGRVAALRILLLFNFTFECIWGAPYATEAEETCEGIYWNYDTVTKTSGSSVKIQYSSGPVLLNWYEAASCCLSKGLHLASVEGRKDLDSYKKLLGSVSRRTKAWSDIHGFGKEWKNLKGAGISSSTPNLFWEAPPSLVQRGSCKVMEFREAFSGDPGPLYLKSHPCSEDRSDVLYCETSDARNAGCPLTSKWYAKSQLEYAVAGPPCKTDVPPTPPPAVPTKPKGAPMRDSDMAVSSGAKLGWRDAKTRCEAAGLLLLVVESEQDNAFLNNNKKLKQPPFGKNEFFWSGARFASTDYTKLVWEPTKKVFPNFMDDDANGINKVWDSAEPLDDEGEGKDLCVDMRFPGPAISPPIWAASDCSLKKNYICVRPPSERATEDSQVTIDDSDTNTPPPTKPAGLQPLEPSMVDYSRGKASWSDAMAKCQKSNLVLMMIENEQDNSFLSNSKRLKAKPYDDRTRFWSAAKFDEYEEDEYTTSHLYWEPMKKEILDPFSRAATTVNRKWADVDVRQDAYKICVDISFPQGQPSVWRVSDCTEKRYFICMRPAKDRIPGGIKRLPARIMDNLEEDQEAPPLAPSDWTPSKGKQPWNVAQSVCQKSKMVLMTIETQEDNEMIQMSERLKKAPFSASTPFWSGGKFTSTDYTALLWEPSKKEFPDFLSNTGNGVRKQWAKGEPADDTAMGKETCVDIKFTNRGLPVWSASDCDERRYFICMRPPKDRIDTPEVAAKPLIEPADVPEVPEQPPTPLKDADVATSKSMLPWEDAKRKCLDNGLVLLTIESEDDNRLLNYNKKLKQRPLSAETDFWSGGKFTSIEYTKFIWDPTKKEFPNFRANGGNGIRKWWASGEPFDDSYVGNDLCVSMRFPGSTPPVWTASDCNQPKYYICTRPMTQRNEPPKKPVQIFEPDAEDTPKEADAKPLPGTFYPHHRGKRPINGSVEPGKPKLFIPDEPSQVVSVVTPGTFVPSPSSPPEDYPFGSIHGSIKPYPAKKGSCEFLPDKFIPGEFKPDNGMPIPGKLTQDSPPSFTPDAPPYITKPIAGSWRPTTGFVPNHPSKTVHGTIRPIPSSKTDTQFTPDQDVHGTFIPDDTKLPVYGSMTQRIPPQFTPYTPEELFQTPTPGIWKPKPTNSYSVTHGVMQPNDDTTNTFLPDQEDFGVFVPDGDPAAPIPGSMTNTKPEIFTPLEPTDFSAPIPGTWKPSGKQKPTHGLLRQRPDIPDKSALFEPVTDTPPPPPKTPAPPPKVAAPPPKVAAPPSKVAGPPPKVSSAPPKVTRPKVEEVGFEPEEVQPPRKKDGPATGVFVADSNPKKLIFGSLKPGEPLLFTPDDLTEAVTRPTAGTFKPTQSNAPTFPFSTLHGTLKPFPALPATSVFLPDTTIVGEFIPDKAGQPMGGTISQEGPAIFIPDLPPHIQKPTPGSWRPTPGILPTHPCNTIHGSMQPQPDGVVFVPDPSQHGTFTADNAKKPVPGSLSQTNPPRFTPDSVSFKLPAPTSGTWRPKPLHHLASVSHGTMKPSPDGFIFVPDEMIPGKFIPDKDPSNVMDGHMTGSVPQIFTPTEDKDLSRWIPGNWKAENLPPVHGTLKPDIYLPPNHARFEPGSVLKVPDIIVGKFYPEDRPKTPITGKVTKEAPFKFTPDNPLVDLRDTPKGVWVPDNTTDPNDPFSSILGVIDQGLDGPVFIPDILVDGQFIPDGGGAPLEGSMNMDNNPKIFTPKSGAPELRPSLGTWHPTSGSPFYPYSNIRGVLKPSGVDPGAAYFTPDLTVEGEFIPEGEAPVPGNMNQASPAIYTPYEPLNMAQPTDGVWRPFGGPSSNFPFAVTPGTLHPTPDPFGGTYYIFIPFSKVKGVFIPDDPSAKQVKGQATQSNPAKFLPDGATNAVKKPTSGTWKLTGKFVPDDPIYFTHCVLLPPTNTSRTQVLFAPDPTTDGKFIPDGPNGVNNAIPGTLTKPQGGNRPVFRPLNNDVIMTPMGGVFTPDASQPLAWFTFPIHGTLSAPKNKALPAFYVYFSPDTTAAPTKTQPPKETKKPQNKKHHKGAPAKEKKKKEPNTPEYENAAVFDPDAPDNAEEDCDPNLQSVDQNDRFFVSCNKNSAQ